MAENDNNNQNNQNNQNNDASNETNELLRQLIQQNARSDEQQEELERLKQQQEEQNHKKSDKEINKNSLEAATSASKSFGKKALSKLDEKTSGFDGSPISFIRACFRTAYELLQAIKEYIDTMRAARKQEREEAEETARQERESESVKNNQDF